MKNIYAIFDRIADEIVGLRMYSLMVFRTNEEATRYFADAINDKSSILNKHPADYALIQLGKLTIDNKLISFETPQNIVTGDTIISLQLDILRNEEPGENH